MDYAGWAFKPDEKEKRAEIQERHKKVSELLKGKVEWTHGSGYNHRTFTAVVDPSVADQVNEMDILICADSGNLCFGGTCTRKGNVFSGRYSID